MILYLDASALVKRYVQEVGSAEVAATIAAADLVGTAVVSRAEVAAALAKAKRMGILGTAAAEAALQSVRREWLDFVRVQVSEWVVSRADVLAWQYDLRGYGAVQLASALVWSEGMGEPVTLATFDQQLSSAAREVGLIPFPADLPGWLDRAVTTSPQNRS